MKKQIIFILTPLVFILFNFNQVKKDITPQKITFPSKDGLTITANLYYNSTNQTTILLCHQARYNKFEYVGIAQRLYELGFNCICIDQRSGGNLIEEFNETNTEAKKNKKNVDFLDAEQDIEAAINYTFDKYKKPIIIWGSSYSSTLVLYLASNNPKVKAVISFSPGNYFEKEKGNIKEVVEKLTIPIFLTSSKKESKELENTVAGNLKKDQIQFIPDSAGMHGSSALWKTSANNQEYWLAITQFLKTVQ